MLLLLLVPRGVLVGPLTLWHLLCPLLPSNKPHCQRMAPNGCSRSTACGVT